MGNRFAEIAFTPAVQAQQEAHGTRASYARSSEGPPWNDRFTEKETEFIQARDGFYLASVSATGWPYVQFRGGPPGFLRVLDERTLGWADFRGNRQYVSTGNVSGDDRVALILMDYRNRRRLKIFGRAELLEVGADDGLAARLAIPGYEAVVERAVRVRVEGFDWNCPQHITPRFTLAEIEEASLPLRERIAELERRCAPDPQQNLDLVALRHPVHRSPRRPSPPCVQRGSPQPPSGSTGDRQESPESIR